MKDIDKELKGIRREQAKISRKVEYVLNSIMVVIGLFNARNSDTRIETVMGCLVAGLALICQGILVFEDIKEIIDDPDEDGESEADE